MSDVFTTSMLARDAARVLLTSLSVRKIEDRVPKPPLYTDCNCHLIQSSAALRAHLLLKDV